jgi:hypothetical protein
MNVPFTLENSIVLGEVPGGLAVVNMRRVGRSDSG